VGGADKMSDNIAKRSFLAVLTFIVFITPLLLTDEVSLFNNWLFIFISWSLIILLSALQPSEKDDITVTQADLAPKD
jgi:O-antigen ligase